ncbi:hypothetical protein Tco_0121688 [Tanacetum coccineum]
MATCHHLSGATWRKHCSPTVGQPPSDHRSTVVNDGGQRWSTTVNTAGPPVNGGGQRWRTTVDHRRTTGQGGSTVGSWAGPGIGPSRVESRAWIGSGSGRHVASPEWATCHNNENPHPGKPGLKLSTSRKEAMRTSAVLSIASCNSSRKRISLRVIVVDLNAEGHRSSKQEISHLLHKESLTSRG